MASKWLQQLSDGQTDVMYDFGLRPESAAEVSALINAAARTFHGECGGRWRDPLMTAHVNALADMLVRHRALTNRMFRSGDPLLVEMIRRATAALPAKLDARRQERDAGPV